MIWFPIFRLRSIQMAMLNDTFNGNKFKLKSCSVFSLSCHFLASVQFDALKKYHLFSIFVFSLVSIHCDNALQEIKPQRTMAFIVIVRYIPRRRKKYIQYLVLATFSLDAQNGRMKIQMHNNQNGSNQGNLIESREREI